MNKRSNYLGEIRRSQVLGYGPGAIIDFRAGPQGGGAVSVVAPGLEFWDEFAGPAFPRNDQAISEPRLERKLRVKGFRLPPVDFKPSYMKGAPDNGPKLPGFRFPKWLQCPSCNQVKLARQWDNEPGNPTCWCSFCTSKKGKRIYAVPTRFVVACEHGHLEEFPWEFWLRGGTQTGNGSCQEQKKHCTLKLENRGGMGLSSLYLMCSVCGAYRSMGDIFRQGSLGGLKCSGSTPWLDKDNDDCSQKPRVIQRGASNLYFPIEVSALSVPPWSDAFQSALGTHWDTFANSIDGDDRTILSYLVKTLAGDLIEEHGMEVDDICSEIIRRKQYLENPERENLKYDELCSLSGQVLFNNAQKKFTNKDFKIKDKKVPENLTSLISKVVSVERLREVRALKGFTRINQPADAFESGKSKFGQISKGALPWLPAVEVRGEGVFFSLDDNAIEAWSQHEKVAQRAYEIDQAFEQEWSYHEAESDRRIITPKFLLIHSLSHLFLRYLALESGYDTASLRERIYCDEGGKSNNGILIYTASSDAEGTLGGLARMAETSRFENLILRAVYGATWCSSDPLCITSAVSESEPCNHAACHNCSLVPETSCEFFNRFLDRAMVVGSFEGIPGFFEGIVPNK